MTTRCGFPALDRISPTSPWLGAVGTFPLRMKSRLNNSTLLTGILAISGFHSLAHIVPLTQDRSLDSDVFARAALPAESDSSSLDAPDFAVFNAEVDPSVVDLAGSRFVIAQAVANQNSKFGLNFISATGQATGVISLSASSTLPAFLGTASGSSLFDVTFDVNERSKFVLKGNVDTQAVTTGGAGAPTTSNQILFRDLTNNLDLFSALSDDESFLATGILEVGTYRLVASASVSVSQTSSANSVRSVNGISSYDLRLDTTSIVPEPGTVVAMVGLGAICGATWFQSRRRSRP